MATTSWNRKPFDRRVPLESDEWRKVPSRKKKDLKKYCRGKEGRAHNFELKKYSWANGRPCSPANNGFYWAGCHCIPTCTVCGKTQWRNKNVTYCAEYYANAARLTQARYDAARLKYFGG